MLLSTLEIYSSLELFLHEPKSGLWYEEMSFYPKYLRPVNLEISLVNTEHAEPRDGMIRTSPNRWMWSVASQAIIHHWDQFQMDLKF
jgi:hypothetical protein